MNNPQIRMREIGFCVIYNPKATMRLTENNHPQTVLPDFNFLRVGGQISTSPLCWTVWNPADSRGTEPEGKRAQGVLGGGEEGRSAHMVQLTHGFWFKPQGRETAESGQRSLFLSL